MQPATSDVPEFAGVPIQATSLGGAVAQFLRSVTSGTPSVHRFVNAYSIAIAERDAGYRDLLRGPGMNYPDGKPLAFVLRLTHASRGTRQIAGPSFFNHCLDRGRHDGVRHFFLGGGQSLLRDLTSAVERLYPGVEVAGSFAPPFRPMTQAEQAEQDELIRRSGADVVWVALGTPKQDFEALRVWRSTGLTVAAVGAAFDFAAGTKPRAPRWMSIIGLEWLFRLLTEPRRLWRRYLFGNARFLRLVWRELTSGRR